MYKSHCCRNTLLKTIHIQSVSFAPSTYLLPFHHNTSSSNRSGRIQKNLYSTSIMTISPITFVTGNANKLKEVQRILASDPDAKESIRIVSKKIDLPELQGEIEDIVREKCLLAAKEIQGPTLVEDTCLCFNALKGLPGPYIKWFLDKIGHDGLNKMLVGFDDKSAFAVCSFGYFSGKEGDEPLIFTGKTPGNIVPARAKGDGPVFGWDPIFEPEGHSQTYAEMEKSAKDSISHRAKAVVLLKKHFESTSAQS